MIDKRPDRPRRNTSDSLPFHFDDERPSDASQCTPLQTSLPHNSSLSYQALLANAPSRPLEFPAPTVNVGETKSDYVMDHRSQRVFYASSVLMRRTLHARDCVNNSTGGIGSGIGTSGRGRGQTNNSRNRHVRNTSRDSVHSWHSPSYQGQFSFGGSPTHAPHNTKNGSQAGGGSQMIHPSNHNTNNPNTSGYSTNNAHGTRCSPACTLPTKAYCVRRKICDTIYGSVRLCVVLRRIESDDGMHGYSHGDGTAVWETTDQMVAVKVINWSKLQQLRGRHLEDPIKELAAMQLLGNYHPHILPLKDSLQDEAHLFCIYPFLTGGDLYGRLWEEMQLSPSGRIEENQARNWFRQILSALSHLQKKGVCHRDLRMENMMLEKHSDGTMNIRIIDFGLCLRVPYVDPNNRNLVTDVSSDTVRRLIKAQGQGGKWEYMAPEVARRQECFDGFAIDLWAVAIILFEFLIGKKPFALPDSSDPNFYMIAVEGNLEGLLRMKGISLDKEACDLLQKMLQSDPSKRLTLAEVVSHPWVNRGHNERKPKPILTSVEESNNGWFIQNNAIDDNDPNEYYLAHRMRLMSCSSGDDGTAESTTFDEESRNPRVSTQSMPYNISDEQLLNDVYDDKPVPATVEHGILQLGVAERKKKGLTSFFNPKKLWKGHTKKTLRLTSIESGVCSTENEDAPPKTELRGDGRMC